MKNVRWATAALTVIVAAGLLVAAASARVSSPTKQAASIQACALLPDTTSSTRYTLFDAPYLKAAFKKAGIAATVVNAHNDPQKQKSQAQQCLAQGAKVILLDQLDATSGAAITNLAVSQHAKVIDYDRLVVGSKASYYVSFQNPVVGKLQAKGMIAALKARHQYANHPVIAELNGDIKDNNAKLFKQGYDSILKPLYKSGVFKLAQSGDQWTQWSATVARTEFDQMLAQNGNKINAVLAANDGIAGAVVASLKDQPRSARITPAGSFQRNKAPLTDSVRASLRHSTDASPPMTRISSPIQLLIADGVSVHGLVQPTSVFSSGRLART